MFNHYDPEAQIHGVKHGGKDLNVRFRTRDDQRIDALIAKERVKHGSSERGISRFIDDRSERN